MIPQQETLMNTIGATTATDILCPLCEKELLERDSRDADIMVCALCEFEVSVTAEDGGYIISDDVLNIHGQGDSIKEAFADYKGFLQQYYAYLCKMSIN